MTTGGGKEQTKQQAEKSEEENFNFVSLITSTDVVFNYFVLTAQAAVRGAGKTSGELEIETEPKKKSNTMKKETMGIWLHWQRLFSWQSAHSQHQHIWWASSQLFSYCFVRCSFLIRKSPKVVKTELIFSLHGNAMGDDRHPRGLR